MAARSKPGLKSLLFLLTLSAVMISSGCTTTTDGISYGNGVIITGFESDMGSNSIESGDEVSLMLKIQNQGEVEAREVKAVMTGIDLDEWGSSYVYSSDEKPIGTLLSADPVTGTTGQTNTQQWNLKAPDLPTGTTSSRS